MTFTIWHIIGACGIVAIIAAVIATIRTRRKDSKKVAYMMDALEDGELNFRFQDKNKFNRTLNRIRTIFEKQRQAHEQRQKQRRDPLFHASPSPKIAGLFYA